MNSADTRNWDVSRGMADSYSSTSHDVCQFSVPAEKFKERGKNQLKKFYLWQTWFRKPVLIKETLYCELAQRF